MAKKRRRARAAIVDFDFGIEGVIPSTQEAYRSGTTADLGIRRDESERKKLFMEAVSVDVRKRLRESSQFPSRGEIFVFIVQYLAGEALFQNRDVDNLAKTMLDLLNGIIYRNDSQVRVLLVVKKRTDNRVTQNFAYVAVKELADGGDMEIVKSAGIERAVTRFQELKSGGVL